MALIKVTVLAAAIHLLTVYSKGGKIWGNTDFRDRVLNLHIQLRVLTPWGSLCPSVSPAAFPFEEVHNTHDSLQVGSLHGFRMCERLPIVWVMF